MSGALLEDIGNREIEGLFSGISCSLDILNTTRPTIDRF